MIENRLKTILFRGITFRFLNCFSNRKENLLTSENGQKNIILEIVTTTFLKLNKFEMFSELCDLSLFFIKFNT